MQADYLVTVKPHQLPACALTPLIERLDGGTRLLVEISAIYL